MAVGIGNYVGIYTGGYFTSSTAVPDYTSVYTAGWFSTIVFVPDVFGTGSVELSELTLDGTGTLTHKSVVSGTGSIDLSELTLDGTARNTRITGTGSVALSALTLDGTGTLTHKPIVSATGSIDLSELTLDGTGTLTHKSVVSGTGSIDLSELTSTGSGITGVPSITSVLPQITSIGDNVVITGENFTATGNVVYIDGVLATVVSQSTTSITVTVPAVTITTVDLVLTTGSGYTVTETDALTIESAEKGYEEFIPMPNEFFSFNQNSGYDGDKTLYKRLQAEAFNIYGTPMMYYVITYNTAYDPMFGEDNNKRIYRRFPINAVFELPKEEDSYARFGLENLDNFEMHVNQLHFTEASKYQTSGLELYPPERDTTKTQVYTSYTPSVGDILRAEYSDVYYEIVSVHQEEEMFLQDKHAWRFQVRVFRDENLSLTPTTSGAMTEISAVSNIDDILEVNDYITSSVENIKYTSGASEESSNQPDINDGWF